MSVTRKPVKYLNNKSLLAEIHKSKLTFCSYLEPEYADFDGVVADIKEITPALIEELKIKRCLVRKKIVGDPADIATDSIVVRVMNDDHVPLDPGGAAQRRGPRRERASTTFPPFRHYILTADGLKEVCRSHWIGGFENGHFSADHGRINDALGRMMMLLVRRYASRGNWRGYTYNDEFQGAALVQLSQVGLQFNELKSDNPFAFYTTVINNCFKRVENLEKKGRNIRDALLLINGAPTSSGYQNPDR